MLQQYVELPRVNLSMPPPTIWNVNTILKEPEPNLSKQWFSKLEPISESNRISPSEKSSTQSRIPLPYSSFSSGPQHRGEALNLKVPIASKLPSSLTGYDSTSGYHSNSSCARNESGRKKMTKTKAAIIIQRAYRGYLLRRLVVEETQTELSRHQFTKSNTGRSKKESFSTSEPPPGKAKCIIPSSKGLALTDYLKEGSLFFAERESVLVFGGIDPHSKYGDGRNTGRNIFRYNSELNQWDLVGELPQPRHHHAVAFLKGKVYLAGGTDPRDDEQGKTVVVGTMWSFDPVTRAWYKEKELLTPRKNFGLVVMNGKLLAIGGQDKDGKILSSVERYDPISGHWEYIASLNTERTGAAATKYNDTVWVAGGMTNSRKTPLTSTVESYDARFNVWVEQSNLRFPRCFGCLFAMNETLYYIGGAGRASEKERTTSSCNAIDLWNPKEQEWKLHFAMSIPRHGHAVAYLGTQILIIGGVTTAYLRALTDVECFCCERKTWVKGLTVLPVPLSGHGAVTLPPASLM